jgi:hypothetical protein
MYSINILLFLTVARPQGLHYSGKNSSLASSLHKVISTQMTSNSTQGSHTYEIDQ